MEQIKIGTEATIYIGSDSYPATVIDITPSGKTVTCQVDNYKFISGDASVGTAEYEYSRDPNGRMIKFRYSSKYSGWRNSSYKVYFGYRRFYRDPSF